MTAEKEAMKKVGEFWMTLIKESLPPVQDTSLEFIINFHKEGLSTFLNENKTGIEAMSLESIKKYMSKPRKWKKMNVGETKRRVFLRQLLSFRAIEHYETLNLTKFREIVDIERLKIIFSKTYFINYTVKENGVNSLLTFQGFYMKAFIYFHLRHDMKFRASIDSLMIEMDNPYTRQAIRDENMNDNYLCEKYRSISFHIEEFVLYLLRNFFPNISGIWAEHSQMCPVYVLQFIRIVLEFGFISLGVAREMMPLIHKATMALVKLEEGWLEKQPEDKKFSVRLKLHDITHLFAKCREHISMIVIQLLLLYNDHYFMTHFPRYVTATSNESRIKEDLVKNITFFNKDLNDQVLFICMNYLSNTVCIMNHKSTNQFCTKATEKIFLFLASTQKDCFLNSLKQINMEDLKYIDAFDPITSEVRDMADNIGNTLNKLLDILCKGGFDKDYGSLDQNYVNDPGYEKFVKKYANSKKGSNVSMSQSRLSEPNSNSQRNLHPPVPNERTPINIPILYDILKNLRTEILKILDIHTDFKVALVKESVSLKLIALARYSSDYFAPDVYNMVAKFCFSTLDIITTNNNFSKAQIFKGACFYHFKHLLSSFDHQAFMFLFKICTYENGSYFLGGEVLLIFLHLYEEFNNLTCKTISVEDPTAGMDLQRCGTLLLMTNYLISLFSKNFLSDTDKVNNKILVQELIFPNFSAIFLPVLIKYMSSLYNHNSPPVQGSFTNKVFMAGEEETLMNMISKGEADPLSKDILMCHLCFSVFKLYNSLTTTFYSQLQFDVLQPQSEALETFLLTEQLPAQPWVLPIELDSQVMVFLRNFKLLPEQQILIENEIKDDFNILDTTSNEKKKHVKREIANIFREMRKREEKIQAIKDEGGAAPAALEEELKGFEKRKINLDIRIRQLDLSDISIISRCCARIRHFSGNPEYEIQGKTFCFMGVIPFLNKYFKALKHQTVFNSSKKTKAAMKKVEHLVAIFRLLVPHLNKITGKPLLFDISELGFKESDLPSVGQNGLIVSTNLMNLDGEEEIPKPAPGQSINLFDLTENQKEFTINRSLDKMIELLEEYAEMTEWSAYAFPTPDISKEDFLASILSQKCDQLSDDRLLNKKKTILGVVTMIYQSVKEDYIQRDEEPNLIGFFNQNPQNLKGVFTSCLDRLLNENKADRLLGKQYIAENVPVSRFWGNPSTVAYVGMVGMLVEKSKTARKELYEFIKETGEEKNEKRMDFLNLEHEEDVQAMLDMSVASMLSAPNNLPQRNNKAFLSILIRIQSDLLWFLANNSQRHSTWWMLYQNYEMISMLFKNLCECNFMAFKEYLAEEIPSCSDNGWNRFTGSTYTEVFSTQFKTLMNLSRISKNRNSTLIPSDAHERMIPILLPLLKVINEITLGPCVPNQKIFINTDLESMTNLAMRIIDEVDSEYFEVANLALSVLTALTEGHDPVCLGKIATSLPSSMIIDRVKRYIKKLYIKILIDSGSFKKRSTQAPSDSQKDLAMSSNSVYPKQPSNTLSIDATTSQHQRMMALVKEVAETDTLVITHEMEKRHRITNWQQLFETYLRKKEFSESNMFEFAFRLFVIWKTLALHSKNHAFSMAEKEEECDQYFNKNSFFSAITSQRLLSIASKLKLTKDPPEFACIFYFITKKILTDIEILDPQEESVVLYFPRQPPCFMLSDEAKKNYRADCNISDSNTKMVDLLSNFNLFCIQMNSSFQTGQTLGPFYSIISSDAFYYYTLLCWIIGFGLNMVFLFGYHYEEESDSFKSENESVTSVFYLLTVILIAAAATFLVLWFLTTYKQTYKIKMEDYKFDYPDRNPKSVRARFIVGFIRSYLYQTFPIAYSLHVAFTMLGYGYSPVFTALNLLLIININQTTRFVLKSIILHIDQLLLTLMLTIFVIFIYTMIVMNFMYEQILAEDGDEICHDLYICFFYVLNLGLRNGGGFAENLEDIDKEEKFIGRTFYDITFFIFINVISLNIIFGIIIDTFSQLRDDQNERGRHD